MKIDGPLLVPRLAASGEEAQRLEAQGFDGAFGFEGPHDAFLPLALAARATRRIELGTAIAVAFARNPMTCAQQANDLQLLSEGRFILGLGTQIEPHILAATLPALHRGLAASGRRAGACEIACQTIVCLGSDDEEIGRARDKARGQIAFYGSTPAYRGVLEHHGHEALQPRLNALSKQGRWLEMTREIGDELLDLVAVSGTPARVAAQLRARNDFAERTLLGLYNETEPEAVADLVAALRTPGAAPSPRSRPL